MKPDVCGFNSNAPQGSEKKCPFCGSCRVFFWQRKTTTLRDWGIWKCDCCRSGFVWPRPADSELTSQYTSASYGSLTREEADRIDMAYYPTLWGDAELIIGRCVALAPGQRFLDVGAGNGTFSHVAMKNGFQVDATEPNRNACAVFQEANGFRPREEFFDFAFAERFRRSYDVRS